MACLNASTCIWDHTTVTYAPAYVSPHSMQNLQDILYGSQGGQSTHDCDSVLYLQADRRIGFLDGQLPGAASGFAAQCAALIATLSAPMSAARLAAATHSWAYVTIRLRASFRLPYNHEDPAMQGCTQCKSCDFARNCCCCNHLLLLQKSAATCYEHNQGLQCQHTQSHTSRGACRGGP